MRERIDQFKKDRGNDLTIRERNLISKYESGSLSIADKRALDRILKNYTPESVAYQKVRQAMLEINSVYKTIAELEGGNLSDFCSWINYENPEAYLSSVFSEKLSKAEEKIKENSELAYKEAEFRRDTEMISFLKGLKK